MFKKISPIFTLIACISILENSQVQAQSITPANDGTGTQVIQNGKQFDITGGTLSGDKASLFQSFQKFGLNKGEIANFLSNPNIRNILGRVVGGDASIINGLIKLSGGNSNLFLMNPSGVVFGRNARLDVPGTFGVTTANGIGFGEFWFNAIGNNDYQNLVGDPNAFAFTMNQPGAIINFGDLEVKPGQDLMLLGGTVVSTGKVSSPDGNVVVTSVPGQSLVKLSIPGQVLTLEVDPQGLAGINVNQGQLPTAMLSDLLTLGEVESDKSVQVKNNQVLVGESQIPVKKGDTVVQNLNANQGIISAPGNVSLVESNLKTTGDLNIVAGKQVLVRDTANNPFGVVAGENLTLKGYQGIDISALNNSVTPFQSGGDLTLISGGGLRLDSHFYSGGNFSVQSLDGKAGNVYSIQDPIIIADGDVNFGDYEGVALKVEATGSITGENIRITGADTTGIPTSDPDFDILTNQPALILRAGVNIFNLSDGPNVPKPAGGTTFTGTRNNNSSATITVGSINTSSDTENGGYV
ncbi:MAG: filamentous hemagglutinin N-terminal domain-containing protein, partial [Sphaerospermopsis sp. SIO1G2]|nr:filamentous hemagglutinin N-terminal domain-containing protein [Sphaerospermopsis sp. SIO1G2]